GLQLLHLLPQLGLGAVQALDRARQLVQVPAHLLLIEAPSDDVEVVTGDVLRVERIRHGVPMVRPGAGLVGDAPNPPVSGSPSGPAPLSGPRSGCRGARRGARRRGPRPARGRDRGSGSPPRREAAGASSGSVAGSSVGVTA